MMEEYKNIDKVLDRINEITYSMMLLSKELRELSTEIESQVVNVEEQRDELLEWLHTFDDLQFSCNHRNVIEKIWQIKSKQK